MALKLLDNATVAANGTSFKIVEHDRGHVPKRFSYGVYYFGVFPTSSPEVKLQASHDDVSFADIPNSAKTTTDQTFNVEFYGNYIRAVLAGTGGSISVTVVLV